MSRPLHHAVVLALATVVATAVAGCTLEPTYLRPPSPVADSYPTPASATGPAADTIGWSSFFVDPRLKRLIDLALANNRDLRVAILNIEEARAQYRIERAALFPTLDGTASFSRARTPADLSIYRRSIIANTASVEASTAWEIDLFGKNRSLSHAAIDKYLASEEARRATQIALVSQVADQYLTVLAYNAQLEVSRKTLAAAKASLDLTKAQFATGEENALDLSEAETVVDQAEATLAQQTRLRAQAEDQLEVLVGTPLPADLPPALPFGRQTILTDIPPGLPSDLLTRRPDVLEAEDTLRAANANIGAARAAFFPSISLTGEYGTASSALSGLFGSNRAIWSVGPSINLPVFEGGTNFANLKLAKAQTAVAVAQYEKTIQTAFQEVADGLVARATYNDQVDALARDETAQQTRLSLSSLRYRTGVDSYLSVLTAQDDLYAVQLNLITTRLAQSTNLVDLYRALGGGWSKTGSSGAPS
jgi:multidrug efflux system outer membrane protein